MPGHLTIPVGEHEGRIALRVPIPELDLDDEAALVGPAQSAAPGVAFLVLDGEVPWGDPRVARWINVLDATPSPRKLQVWACRAIDQRRWPAASVWTVIDASVLLAAPRPTSAVLDAIADLHALPRADELIVREPHLDAISATLLDDLALRLDAGAGWLYVGNDDVRIRAGRESTRAVTPWGVRRA